MILGMASYRSVVTATLLALLAGCSTMNAASVYVEGDNYREKGQYDQAIESYTVAIAHDPGLFHAFNGRGLAYLEQGKYDRALEDFGEAIRLVHLPNRLAEYHNNRGVGYSAKG